MGARIIAIANQKGGVGKTTSTYNLSAAMALHGKRVLMIDLDPQASLTIACGIEPGEKRLEGYSTMTLFQENGDVIETAFKVHGVGDDMFLFVVPSDPELAKVEPDIIKRELGEYFIKDACDTFSEHFDVIFLDCPPNLGPLVINALVAADEVIIPVKTDYLSYRGLELIMDTVNRVKAQKRYNPALIVRGVIATMHRKQTKDHKDILAMLEKTGLLLGVIRESADVPRGDIDGIPVVVSAPKSDVAKAYIEIANKL